MPSEAETLLVEEGRAFWMEWVWVTKQQVTESRPVCRKVHTSLDKDDISGQSSRERERGKEEKLMPTRITPTARMAQETFPHGTPII